MKVKQIKFTVENEIDIIPKLNAQLTDVIRIVKFDITPSEIFNGKGEFDRVVWNVDVWGTY